MTAKELLAFAKKRYACHAAIRWLAALPPETTWDKMRKTVPNAGWVVWLIDRIDDPGSFARIATTDDNIYVRAAATRLLDDQVLLARIATTDSCGHVREMATRRIDDQEILARIATMDTDSFVREAATYRFRAFNVQDVGK